MPMAIIGPIDLDGDGTDDVAKLKALITKNGGTVVASQNSSGEVAGRVDSSTRFLVVEDPSDPVIASNELVLDANKLSVPLIRTQKLLKLLGIRGVRPAESDGFQVRN